MKLFYASTSPYARKVRVAIAEKGLTGIEQIAVSPFDVPPDLVAANPLSKVPALTLANGSTLYDSPVICEYLDTLGIPNQLIPGQHSPYPHSPTAFSMPLSPSHANSIAARSTNALAAGSTGGPPRSIVA